MDIGSTSIDSLPISPQTENNIQMDTQEKNIMIENKSQNLQQSRDNDPSVMQKNLNQFVTGIQQASAAGLTTLPSRDIPQNQEHISRDESIKPNYIPQQQENIDYIGQYQTNEDIVRNQAQKQDKQDSLDILYNTIQTPLLIGVLYFIFQLPVIHKQIFRFLPSLFNTDGNPNLSGYIVKSVAFASSYFMLTKGMVLLER